MNHRWRLTVVCGLCLASLACGDKTQFDDGIAKEIIEGHAVNLDEELVTITPMQLDCGVQSELWDAPSQVSQDRTTARLTPKGRRQLAVETSKWDKLAGAIARILRPSEQEGRP